MAAAKASEARVHKWQLLLAVVVVLAAAVAELLSLSLTTLSLTTLSPTLSPTLLVEQRAQLRQQGQSKAPVARAELQHEHLAAAVRRRAAAVRRCATAAPLRRCATAAPLLATMKPTKHATCRVSAT